jgi:hypothetical protein
MSHREMRMQHGHVGTSLADLGMQHHEVGMSHGEPRMPHEHMATPRGELGLRRRESALRHGEVPFEGHDPLRRRE